MASTLGKLKLYWVYRDDPGYDEQCEVVVAAYNDDDARDVAAATCGDEGRDRWFAPSTNVRLLGTASRGIGHGLICRDFKAG